MTKNEMTVKRIFINNQRIEISGSGYEPKGEIRINQTLSTQHVTQLLHAGIFASNAKVNPPDEEHLDWYCLGDPTEGALITLAKKYNIDTEYLYTQHKQYHQF
ncbi:TPA: hypothetical protein DIC40_00105 [Patescibacteria group bacterium]|nr:hypothetical protein [Candidatus Gracilibacteria bacterium]